MDDPLQHNDVIHASAFMDLMRQLVRRLDYQIIMSTHDSAEAAYLIRPVLARARRIDDRIIDLMTKASNDAVSKQRLMFSLKIPAQQFCEFAAAADRRLS